MSLISAVDDDKTSPQPPQVAVGSVSKTTKKKKHYLEDGKPMSKEAMWRAKMKYGVYSSPISGGAGLGVPDYKLATNKAANFANENQTSVETYKRLYVDQGAASAAVKVGTEKKTPDVDVHAENFKKNKALNLNFKNAAAKAYAVPAEALYNTSEEARHASQKTYSIVSNVSTASTTKMMNMSKVLKGAESKAESRLKKRSDPEKTTYVKSYTMTNEYPARKMDLNSEVMSGIAAKSELPPKQEGPTEKEQQNTKFALGAAQAVKDLDPKSMLPQDLEEKEKQRQEFVRHMTSQSVLSKAQATVNKEIASIDLANSEGRLFDNDSYNRAAITIAQESYQKRLEQASVNKDKINMGGGLYLSPNEVNNIAHGLISPVLGEVSERAESQRAADIEIATRITGFEKDLAYWKNLQKTKQTNDKNVLEVNAKRIEDEKQEAKNASKKKYNDMIKKMDAAVAEKKKQLEIAKQKLEDLQDEMQMKLEMQDQKVEEEMQKWDENRDKDIEAARLEQEELIKPFQEELEGAEKHHEELLSERDGINNEIEHLKESIEGHKKKIEIYETDIRAHENQHEELGGKLEDLGQNKNTLKTNLESEVVIMANKTKEESELAAKEARLKQLQVDSMVNERRSELNQTEIQLKKEKLELLESMRKTAEARGDKKIDEDRVKGLFGMTSEEFIAKNAPPKEEKTDLETVAEGAEDVASTKKEAPVKKAAPTQPVKKQAPPKKQAPVEKKKKTSVFDRFFLGSSKAEKVQQTKQREVAAKSQSKKDAIGKPHLVSSTNENVTSGEKKEVGKTAETKKTAEKPKPASTTTTTAGESEENKLEHTFSGFSQGSVNDDVEGAETSEDAKKDGYFKEVF